MLVEGAEVILQLIQVGTYLIIINHPSISTLNTFLVSQIRPHNDKGLCVRILRKFVKVQWTRYFLSIGYGKHFR